MDLLAGRYRYQRDLGSGSFGTVRQYIDTAAPPQAYVAIKTIPFATIMQEHHRLLREVEIMLFLRDKQPHVISCSAIFVTHDNSPDDAMAPVAPVFHPLQQQGHTTDAGNDDNTSAPVPAAPTMTDLECSKCMHAALSAWLQEVQKVINLIVGTGHLAVNHKTRSPTYPGFSLHFVLPCMSGDVDQFIQSRTSGTALQTRLMGRSHEDAERFYATVTAVMAFQMVYGLDFLHKCNLVHRDLKPENILLRLDHEQAYCSNALIADFGLATQASSAATFYVCTRTYRPPELICGRSSAEATVDVWSLGCIFYELVTYRHLFRIPSARNAKGSWDGTLAARQLEAVMDVIGVPGNVEENLTDLNDPVRSYLLRSDKQRGSKLRMWMREFWKLPACSPEQREQWMDLIEACLRFWPSERPTAEDVCRHPLFASYGMVYTLPDDPEAASKVAQYPSARFEHARLTEAPTDRGNILTTLEMVRSTLEEDAADEWDFITTSAMEALDPAPATHEQDASHGDDGSGEIGAPAQSSAAPATGTSLSSEHHHGHHPTGFSANTAATGRPRGRDARLVAAQQSLVGPPLTTAAVIERFSQMRLQTYEDIRDAASLFEQWLSETEAAIASAQQEQQQSDHHLLRCQAEDCRMVLAFLARLDTWDPYEDLDEEEEEDAEEVVME